MSVAALRNGLIASGILWTFIAALAYAAVRLFA